MKPQANNNNEDEATGGDDTKCVICEYVITTLASKIKDNATEVTSSEVMN